MVHSGAGAVRGMIAVVPKGPSSNGSTLRPIRRGPLYDQVVERLLGFIVEREIAVGERLPGERDLARDLGVSRSSVRQALTVLRVMGIISVRHGHGIHLLRTADDVVPPIGAEVLSGQPRLPLVNEVREALESHAARLAAGRRSDVDLERMEIANEQMREQIGGGDDGVVGDRAFHLAVHAASGNTLLCDLLGGIAAEASQVAAASLARPGQPARSAETHALILDAIRRGEAGTAGHLMLEHLKITGTVEAFPELRL